MSDIQKLFDTHKRFENVLMTKLAEFNERLKPALESQQDISISNLHSDFLKFQELSLGLFGIIKDQINNLQRSADKVEQWQRRKVLLIKGIQESQNENIKNICVDMLSKKLGLVNLQEDVISVCYRIGEVKDNYTRPILIRFRSIEVKSLVWTNKTKLKGSNISVSEFLTPARHHIFQQTRAHFGMKCCWTMDGVVLVKLPSGKRVKVITSCELEDLKKQYPVSTEVMKHQSSQDPKNVPQSSSASSSKTVNTRSKSRNK